MSMRKSAVVLTVLTTVSVLAAGAPEREKQPELEVWTRSTALLLNYGADPGRVGITLDVFDERPLGPASFAIEGDRFVLLDSVNDRLETFDRNGALLQVTAGAQGSELEIATMSAPQSGVEVAQTGEYAAEIRRAGETPIVVATEDVFGSIEFLGEDDAHHLYFVIEELLPGPLIEVRKTVRKYTAAGTLRAVIPIDIDYAAHPQRELVLTADGTLYHLRPLREVLTIDRWETEP